MIPSDRKRKLTLVAHFRVTLLQVITLMEKENDDKKLHYMILARANSLFFSFLFLQDSDLTASEGASVSGIF